MKKLLFIIIILSIYSIKSYSQGCVAIRGAGGICTLNRADTSKWEFNVNTRYFKSYKHFIGTAYQAQREALGTNVINHSFEADFTLVHKLNDRYSYMIDLPILSNSRSSLYEHNNIGRFTTHSFGAGDLRLAFYGWIVNPVQMPRANLQIGLGLKLPTGNYNYQDYFMVTDSTKRLGPVDQSIQLGDGGTGITLELNGYYSFSEKLNLYGNFYYLSNPRDVNGISTARGGIPSTTAVKNGSDVMSVPDQYMARIGLNFRTHGFTFSGGFRDECLPIHDLWGGSDGFRRPGFIISAEPGISYSKNRVNLYFYLPYALIRDRTQSVPDRITTALTGKYTHGDAAFADYLLNFGLTLKF